MKTGKSILVLLFGGIFILMSCVILAQSLAEKSKQLNGDYGMAKAVVTLKDQMNLKNDSKLTREDAKKLAGILGTGDFSYTARPALFRASLKADGISFVSGITGTNYLLPR